jgi:hypothetical protein
MADNSTIVAAANGVKDACTMMGTILAIIGTLAGAALSAILAYIFGRLNTEQQNRWRLEEEERQHTWTLEGEERQRARNIQDQTRQLKKGLLEKRIEPVEEAIRLTSIIFNSAQGKELGVPLPDDDKMIADAKLKLHEIRPSVWQAIDTLGSEEIRKEYKKLSSAYWSLEEGESIENYKGLQDAASVIIKLLDEMRVKNDET